MSIDRHTRTISIAAVIAVGSLAGCGPASTVTDAPTLIAPTRTIAPVVQTEVPTDPLIETPEPRPAATDLDRARAALQAYFAALHRGNYDEAASLYGGSYEQLSVFNPEIDIDDHAALFEYGCGLLMCLDIKNIVDEQQLADDTFQFVVEFQNNDGSLFVLGPCCGATEEDMPPMSQFPYTVKKIDGQFLVQELPVFVP